MQLSYTILDVFTQKRLQGNPLAVIHDADMIPDKLMQAIAKELNLSETVFVQSPKNARHVAELRIFTPSVELPFAGHPTIGAAVLLGLRQKVTAIRLEEKVGTIVALTTPKNKSMGHARFSLPKLPERVGDAPSVEDIARTLGLEVEDIGAGELIPAIYSAGVPYVLVPVRCEAVLSSIKLERRGWQDVFDGESREVYAFAPTKDDRHAQFASRAFVEMDDLREDPATGSAAAALCGLLSDQLFDEDGLVDFSVKQGVDMGRPSLIEAQIKRENGELVHAGIGGHVIILATGTLFLDEDE